MDGDTDGRSIADLVPAAVDTVLDYARTWIAWDGRPRLADGNTWTPHKALRRVSDHLIDHLAEFEARRSGERTIPDAWHGRALTLDSDWARFTEADFDEATSRLRRLAQIYRIRVEAISDEELDQDRGEAWTLRNVVVHVAGVA
jgi:hypothetical protein